MANLEVPLAVLPQRGDKTGYVNPACLKLIFKTIICSGIKLHVVKRDQLCYRHEIMDAK